MYLINYQVVFMDHILFENHKLFWLKMELRYYLKKIYDKDYLEKYLEVCKIIERRID